MSKYEVTNPITPGNNMCESADGVIEAMTIAMNSLMHDLGYANLTEYLADGEDHWINISTADTCKKHAHNCRTIGRG